MTKKGVDKLKEEEYITFAGNETMVTSLEASKMIGCSVRNIGKAIQHGHFPGARKISPQFRHSPYLIPLSEVKAYIAKIKRGQPKKG